MAEEQRIRFRRLRAGRCRWRVGAHPRFRRPGRGGAQVPACGVVCLPAAYPRYEPCL